MMMGTAMTTVMKSNVSGNELFIMEMGFKMSALILYDSRDGRFKLGIGTVMH